MNNNKKLLITILLISIISFINVNAEEKNGWTGDNNDYYYVDGVALTGHQTIDGEKYYFEQDGKMHKYFLKENGKIYYYGYGTGQLKYGWSIIGEDRYYSNKKGEVLTGHQTIDGQKYYFEQDGKMHKYFLTENGKIYYYGYGSGQLKYGWSTIGENRYYSNEKGEVLTGYQTIDGQKYYFEQDGKMYKGFKKEENGKIYYYGINSGQLKYGWSRIKNDIYYSNDNGEILTDYQTINGKNYYFEQDGKMYKGFKTNDDGKKYYYDEQEGYLNYGWKIINGDLYYSNELGEIVTGEVTIDSKKYVFSNNGVFVKKQIEPTYYMQTDDRWAKIRLGNRLFKSTGCAPTSMAMAFTGILNKTILPIDVGNYLYYNTNEYNHYTIGSSGLAIVYASNNYGIKYTPITSKEELKIALLKGNIVFAAMGNGKFATAKWNHAIILHNYSNNSTIAYDPLKPENNGWVSLEQLWNEQSKDPDDSRGGSNFYELK